MVLQFECCGWDNSTDWLDSFFFAEKGKYPESCECKNSTDDDGDDDGDECITVGTGQYIYQDVSYFLQFINVSARVFFVSLWCSYQCYYMGTIFIGNLLS